MSTQQIAELKEAIEIYLKDFGPEFLIEHFEQKVIESNNENLSYYFAKEVEGANINAHEQIVLNGEDYATCFYFARDIEGADKEALFKRMKELFYTVDDSDLDELKTYHASLSTIELMIHQDRNKPKVLEFKKLKK